MSPTASPPNREIAAESFSGGEVPHYEVVVVGAGFSGICAAMGLAAEGIEDFVVLEKANEVGGTWRENTYPGCACDVPSALYSFSFASKPDWSHSFARQPEIQEYVREVVRSSAIEPRIRFGVEALEGSWDEARSEWRLETSAGPIRSRVLIAAAGPLHDPRIPDVPGIERFQGTVFHSAQWDHGHDLTGERVAVVGTGASAIQFVPEIQPQVERLHLFQRTAPWVLPKLDRRVSALEKNALRRIPGLQRLVREAIYGTLELVGHAQRHPRIMEQVQRIGLMHLRRSIPDPELRAALTPDFILGCKRMLFSDTYYPALCRPNVEVVAHAVSEIHEGSVIGADGIEREVDTIIFGTGFHATEPPIAERIRGRDGRTLADVWKGSPQAYLGTVASGFPNGFLIIGPNLGNGHTSAIVLIEAQVRYIVDALRTMRRRGLASVEVRAEVEDAYNDEVQEALAGTVWNSGGCSSYYLDRNGRNAAIYPWSTIDLRRRLRRFDPDVYLTREATGAALAA